MSPNDSCPEKNCEKVNKDKSLFTGTVIYCWTTRKIQFIIGLILSILAILLIIIFIAVQLSIIYSYNYGIVIDAGSTGTRAFLYEWKDTQGVVNDVVTEKNSCKTHKLQDVAKNLTNNGLIDCISQIITDIPSSYMIKPSIYLAATAGMRLFKTEHPKETEKIFQDIQAIFDSKGWNAKSVGIIDGKTEAVSAWITTNFLKNAIGKDIPGLSRKTYGALDLGGASTQIAFETNQSGYELKLYGQKYPLYAKSYLCLGANMFYVKYLSKIAVDPNEKELNCVIKNAPIVPPEDSMTCRVNNSQSVDFNKISKPIQTSSSNCRSQIIRILNDEIPRPMPVTNIKFVAVSAFYYYKKFIEEHYNFTGSSLSFQQSTDRLCKEDYNDLKSKFPQNYQYYTNYCFVGHYIVALLRMYGLSELDFSQIEFTDKIKGLSVGWNLGYMIEKTKDIPDVILYRLNMVLFAIVISLCVAFLLLAIFSFTIYMRRQKVDNIDA